MRVKLVDCFYATQPQSHYGDAMSTTVKRVILSYLYRDLQAPHLKGAAADLMLYT